MLLHYGNMLCGVSILSPFLFRLNHVKSNQRWGLRGGGDGEKSREKESFKKISASAKVFIKILDKWSLCPSPLLPGAPCYFYANNNLVVYILLFPPELQRHDLRCVRGGGWGRGSWWGWGERERERGKRERERERWSGYSLKCEKILSGVSIKNKKIAGITCLFQSPHPSSVNPPPFANRHLLKFIGHQAIMHNPSAFTLSFAFHASWLLMCWYFDAVRRRALSLFQFSKGSTGSAFAHTDFFPTTSAHPLPSFSSPQCLT